MAGKIRHSILHGFFSRSGQIIKAYLFCQLYLNQLRYEIDWHIDHKRFGESLHRLLKIFKHIASCAISHVIKLHEFQFA